jgi:hypothetical protein
VTLDVGGIEAERPVLDVGEDGPRPDPEDGVGGRDEREGRADDLVAGTDAKGEQRQLHGVGARGGQEDPAAAEELFQPFFDLLAEGAVAGDTALEGPRHALHLLASKQVSESWIGGAGIRRQS